MHRLPLYAGAPLTPVEREPPLALDGACTRCDMHTEVRNVCLSGEGVPGGVLLIGESPGREEDTVGRPFVGASGKLLRQLVARSWQGPVAFDNALRCAPGRREVKDKHIAACLGYLAATVREARPARVVALGGWAAYAVTGRAIAPFSSRRSYGYLYDAGDEPIPLFFVLHPSAALRNRFVRGWFEADLHWALTAAPPRSAPLLATVRVVANADDARAAVAELTAAPWAAFDVETAGQMHEASFRLLCLSACAQGATSPWAWDGPALADPEARQVLVDWLEDATAKKIGQNVKFDMGAVRLTLGARARGVVGDTRLWRKLLEPEAEGKLDKMAELVGMGGTKEEAQGVMAPLVDKVRKALNTETMLEKRAQQPDKKWPKLHASRTEAVAWFAQLEAAEPALCKVIREDPKTWERWAYALVDRPTLLRYNGRDSVATARLGELLEVELAAVPEVDRIRRKVVDGAGNAIARLEEWGMAADRGAINAFDAHLAMLLVPVRKRLDAYGADFNPDSTPAVAELLYKKLGLRAPKQTATGKDSTDKGVLELLADQHPVASDIVEWRRLNKLRGTYATGMLEHVRSDGRIHTSILLDGARSGRTSSQSPNLQNIPRPDSVEGKMARDVFVASSLDHVLLQFDYSQLELRIAAALSQDPEMIKIFLEGVDYHQRTAELVSKLAWGIPPELVEKKHRSQAKTINFGVLYGMGDGALAAKLGSTAQEAARIREAIMGKLKVLDAWIRDCLKYSQKSGLAWTWWERERARRRPMWQIADADDGKRVVAEHGAHNTPVQGTSSEYCVASLAECVGWIDSEGLEDKVKLVLPVHDALLFDVHRDYVAETVGVVREIMTGWDSWDVPLSVDVEIGRAWGSLRKFGGDDAQA